MKIIFRCDSSFSIGSGHLVRCLNLAHLLEGEIIFICRNLSGNINSRVIQNQFKLIELPDIPGYSVEGKIVEIEEVEPCLSIQKPDLVIVDHYGLDEEWEMAAKKWAKKVIAIDDLGRKHNADIILDQNFRNSVPQNYIASNAELFLGPMFALLDRSFIEIPPPSRDFKAVRNILVFFGGSDNQDMTLKTIEIIIDHFPNIEWEIVIGAQNRSLEEIKRHTDKRKNIRLHINTPNMANLMAKSDLFIGAGGTTNWERARLGLPSLVISVARNQELICEELAKKKIIYYLGTSSSITNEELMVTLKYLVCTPSTLQSLSVNSLSLNPGKELDNLTSRLLKL